eukprot:TRINITY_DN24676_c0_g1_i1.p1 TRINITY_DN24676_c0_g1~~TRINITY_DN24676_c0_g1_i1.p1  ORF type:complete len:121 (+),score=24.19 TRINITY_DN24676_c0_g1_i1:3-365(+)
MAMEGVSLAMALNDSSMLGSLAFSMVEDPEARRSVESALLIGDKVVNAPPLDDFPHQLDLGEQWKKLTNLPFVYAMWACRTGAEQTEPIQRAANLLDRQLQQIKEKQKKKKKKEKVSVQR